MAQAREQEMTALVEEMSARVKEAEGRGAQGPCRGLPHRPTSASRPRHRNAPGRRYPCACGPEGSPHRQGYHFTSLTRYDSTNFSRANRHFAGTSQR